MERRYIKKKTVLALIVAATSASVLSGCNISKKVSDTTKEDVTEVKEIKTSTYGSINGKEIKFDDLEEATLEVSDLLGSIYYDNYINELVAKEKGIDTKNKTYSEIETDLLASYNKEITDEQAKKYVEENPNVYSNFNLKVAKFKTLEESKQYNSKDIDTLAKTVSCSELLKQTDGLTGMTDLRRYTNSLEKFDVGYVTPNAIPFEDGYAFVKIVAKETRVTAVEDAKNDLRNRLNQEGYLADIAAMKEKHPYVR